MTLEQARAAVGRRVLYTGPHGGQENGVITEVGAVYVRVLYDGDDRAKATASNLLELEG